MQTAMKLQILAPQTCPQRGMKDFAKGYRQPVQEPGLAPAAFDSFYPIQHSAERRLADVRREWNPTLMVQPTQKTGEREAIFWHLVGDSDLDFEVFHCATLSLSPNFGQGNKVHFDLP